jgi:hypothetical protein
MMSKASQFGRTLLRRKNETFRQYVLRVRDEGLWRDEVAKEGVQVYLNTYESVRFGGMELTEGEFLATMKLVYYLLTEMKPPETSEYPVESIESSSSSSFSMESRSVESFVDAAFPPLSRDQTISDADILKQMESLLSSPRKSIDTTSATSMIDHGSFLEDATDQEEQDRRIQGERLGEREGSVIYYDID